LAGVADAVSGKLRNLGDFRTRLLALCRGRHPQHRDILAQRRHRLGIFRHVQIAANDGEVGPSVRERLCACARVLSLDRAQVDLAAGLEEGLAQGLNNPEIVAVGRANRDPQGDRAHREVIAGR